MECVNARVTRFRSQPGLRAAGPGAGGRPGNFAFLMYPCAMTPSGQKDALDPAQFHYEISSREIQM